MTDSLTGHEPGEKTDRTQRRRAIAVLVAQQGRVTVEELKERFGISGVTARGDLDALEGAGDLVRSHGGAVSTVLVPRPNGESCYTNEQVRLAEAAVRLIGQAETVMLCSGGAMEEVARLMANERAVARTVITYSLPIASVLSDAAQVSLVMLGGLHRFPSGSFVGPHAEQMMKSLHAGHCFLNAPGVSVESGVTTPDIMEAHLNQRMMEAASQVTVVAELASFGQRSLALIAPIEKIGRIICDRKVPAGDLAALRQRGVEVLVV